VAGINYRGQPHTTMGNRTRVTRSAGWGGVSALLKDAVALLVVSVMCFLTLPYVAGSQCILGNDAMRSVGAQMSLWSYAALSFGAGFLEGGLLALVAWAIAGRPHAALVGGVLGHVATRFHWGTMGVYVHVWPPGLAVAGVLGLLSGASVGVLALPTRTARRECHVGEIAGSVDGPGESARGADDVGP